MINSNPLKTNVLFTDTCSMDIQNIMSYIPKSYTLFYDPNRAI